MGCADAIHILKSYQAEVAGEYNISAIGVFGSVARETANEQSDVDVVIQIEKPDLFMLVDIKQALEERFQRSVDLVAYRDNMNPFLKQKIDKEAVYA